MLIEKDDLTNQKVLEVYRAAFMEAEMDDDGDVRVIVDGVKVYARVADGKPFFVLMAGFGLRDGVDKYAALELANRFNDRMIMVRCAVPERDGVSTALWFDHWTMTEGGISAEEIVRVTQRFPRVVQQGIGEYDTEDIVK